MTAALIATGASAQGASERANQWQDSATADRSDVRTPTKAKTPIATPRGTSSFASVPAARTRAAASPFDGDWSVLIETRVGACAPTFRYGVQIQNGEVVNGGGEQVALAGRVAHNGAGRLSRTSGGGTWQGQGSRGTCAGTWVAERRQ
jgi:hypothetical protein